VTRRWFWPSFASPGVVWLVLLFLVPTYAVVAVAFGTTDPIFNQPVPIWNPFHWQFDGMRTVLDGLRPGNAFWIVFVRTFAYGTRSRTTSRDTPDEAEGFCSSCSSCPSGSAT
jgi:ABC-type glycerol-3-phosphate transport system permease component